MKFVYVKIPAVCPRCLREDTRYYEKKSQLKCKVCGYNGHWLQFMEGQKSRELVQIMFTEGRRTGDEELIRGVPALGGAEKPIDSAGSLIKK